MLLAVFRAPLWLFLLITVVVALAAVFEYLGIAAGYGFEPFRLLTYLYTAALFVVYLLRAGVWRRQRCWREFCCSSCLRPFC